MTQSKNQHMIYLGANNLDSYVVSEFLLTSRLKWIDPQEIDLIKILAIVLKDVFLNLILNILKSYENQTIFIPLAPDKGEMKREKLSEYQLKIADLQNVPTGNVKKLVPNFFD